MLNIEKEIQSTLKLLGINNTEIKLYTSLAINGPQTISELSRSSKVERTKIYRSSDNLEKLQLIEFQVDEHRKILHASPLTNLESVISSKLANLKNATLNIEKLSFEITSMNKPESANVRFFHGIKGVKQLLWNQTHSKSEIVSILSENIKTYTGKTFFESWTEKCNINNLKFRSVVNDQFIKDQIKWYQGKYSQTLKNWTSRKIQKDSDKVLSSITVYDDITTFFSWKEKDIFGIEIHDFSIANTHRHFFEMLWEASTPMRSEK